MVVTLKRHFFCSDYGQQYTTTVTQKPIQSTYRPSTVSTQPPPRETYVQSYNPEYDEALISQVIIDHPDHHCAV